MTSSAPQRGREGVYHTIYVYNTHTFFEHAPFLGRCSSVSLEAGDKAPMLNLSYGPSLCRALSMNLHRVPSC